ncbi:MAG: HIT family protein [Candidatus Magasanikbacteria bacterium]|nr:HIT family protein [Candidatus Magasanikbacteria bacterium]
MMPDCIFCKIISGEVPSAKVYEDDKVLAFLDINPVNPGHTLVIPKTHFNNFSSTTDGDLESLVVASKKIAAAILRATGHDAFNLTVNNGVEAGQVVPHTHFHIIPRFNGDGHRLWAGKAYAAGEMEEMGGRIKKYVEEN